MYARGILSLAAFLLVAGELPAQDQAQPPLRMIFGVWQDTSGAGYASKHMSKTTWDQVAAGAVLVKDKAGHVQVSQRYNEAGGSVTALQASEIVDTAIARLSAAPSNPDSVSGYVASVPARRLSEEDLKKVVTMFGPGQSALILLSPKPAIPELQRALGAGAQSNAKIVEVEIQQ